MSSFHIALKLKSERENCSMHCLYLSANHDSLYKLAGCMTPDHKQSPTTKDR